MKPFIVGQKFLSLKNISELGNAELSLDLFIFPCLVSHSNASLTVEIFMKLLLHACVRLSLFTCCLVRHSASQCVMELTSSVRGKKK